jgi:hypothetical protein
VLGTKAFGRLSSHCRRQIERRGGKIVVPIACEGETRKNMCWIDRKSPSAAFEIPV